jgi:hypothetical protein
MNRGHQAHSTLFGAVGRSPGTVLVDNVVPVGTRGADARKRSQAGETEHEAARDEHSRALFAELNSHEKPP